MEQEVKNPKVDITIDNNFDAKIIITCGQCSSVTEILFKHVSVNKNIKCSGCDYEFKMTGDDCKAIQKQLAAIKNKFNKIGK